jgi:hypothetical protein
MAIIKPVKATWGSVKEDRMRRKILSSATVIVTLVAITLVSTGCFGGNNNSGDGNSTPPANTAKPSPTVLPVAATTSGTETAYYTTLDIKVKNEGSEGIVLVKASVTQAGTTNTNEMPVFLSKGETEEIKLTFPLVWKGGDFTYNVQAALP